MSELIIQFRAQILGPFDVEELAVRLVELIASHVPIMKGTVCSDGSVIVRETTVTERVLGLNGNGFVQNGNERLVPIPDCGGFNRVPEPL